MPRQKKVFTAILVGFSIVIMILPFLVSFNEVLTKIAEKNFLYKGVQKYIVPVEAKMMGEVLMPFGYKYSFSPTNSIIIVNGVNLQVTWNCLGWQSFLLLLITLLVGFKGRYKGWSIVEALLIGILGTFWLNILRMIFTVLLAVHAPPVFRIVYHDYLAAITTIAWLFIFWWFSYKYVLEEKEEKKV